MPRSSYHRRHRKRSSSKSSNDEKDDYYRDRERSKKKSDSYYSRSSKKTSESRSHKKRSRRSPSTSDSSSSTTNESSKSSHKSSTIEPLKQQDSFNLNLLDAKVNPQTLNDIEDDSFQQKVFTSSKQKVIIDLQKDTITVPTVECLDQDDSIIHPNFLGDETKKMEKWIRKLYNYRQRLVHE